MSHSVALKKWNEKPENWHKKVKITIRLKRLRVRSEISKDNERQKKKWEKESLNEFWTNFLKRTIPEQINRKKKNEIGSKKRNETRMIGTMRKQK